MDANTHSRATTAAATRSSKLPKARVASPDTHPPPWTSTTAGRRRSGAVAGPHTTIVWVAPPLWQYATVRAGPTGARSISPDPTSADGPPQAAREAAISTGPATTNQRDLGMGRPLVAPISGSCPPRGPGSAGP